MQASLSSCGNVASRFMPMKEVLIRYQFTRRFVVLSAYAGAATARVIGAVGASAMENSMTAHCRCGHAGAPGFRRPRARAVNVGRSGLGLMFWLMWKTFSGS